MSDRLAWLNHGLDCVAGAPPEALSAHPDWSSDPVVREIQTSYEALHGAHLTAQWSEHALAIHPHVPSSSMAASELSELKNLKRAVQQCVFGTTLLLVISVTLAVGLMVASAMHTSDAISGEVSSAPSSYVPIVADFAGPPNYQSAHPGNVLL